MLTGSGLSPDVAHSVFAVDPLMPSSSDGTGGVAGAPSLSAFGCTVLVFIVEFKGSRFVIHLQYSRKLRTEGKSCQYANARIAERQYTLGNRQLHIRHNTNV